MARYRDGQACCCGQWLSRGCYRQGRDVHCLGPRLQAPGCSLCPLRQNVGLSAAERHSAGPQPLHAYCHLYQGRLRPHGSQNGVAGQTSRGAGRQARSCQAQLWRFSDIPSAASGASPNGHEAPTHTAS